MNRRRFIYCAATGLMVPYVRASVPIPLGFFKPASSSVISAAAAAALLDWVTRVQGQGSDVTIAGTQTAVGIYIDAGMTHGWWAKVVRQSINAGDTLAALNAPLKNGGPVATDALSNFVGGDYSQAVGLTGAVGGFGAGVNKRVEPSFNGSIGMNWNDTTGGVSTTDYHMAMYTRNGSDGHTLCQGTVNGSLFANFTTGFSGQSSMFLDSGGNFAYIASGDAGIGHYIGNLSGTTSKFFKNGSQAGNSPQTVTSVNITTARIMIHCQNYIGTPNDGTAQTVEMWSRGLAFTDSEAAYFASDYATLRTALGR